MSGAVAIAPAALLVFALLLSPAPAPAAPAAPGDVFREWDAVDKLVRDGAITKVEARRRFRELHPRLLAAAQRYRPPQEENGGKGGAAEQHRHLPEEVPGTGGTAGPALPNPVRRFPVQGYGPPDIGGKNGSGYAPAGYDYYEGQRHTGHPAHDIFIRDKDQDSRDDAGGKPVPVLSFTDGVVAALSPGWDPKSGTRGGKVVWVFDASQDAFYCYAHLGSVSAELGRRVAAGDVLGTVGRTGRNAAPSRSPTHLHFMRLDFDDGRMTPRDTYRELVRAARNH